MVHIATTHSAHAYTDQQIAEMCAVWADLNRGLLIVVESPPMSCEDLGVECECWVPA